MTEALRYATGINGQIELHAHKIVIKRHGFFAFAAHGFKGDKEILLKQISAIQFKKAGFFANGYIQFSFLGGTESKKGIYDAIKDENTVVFNTSGNEYFLAMKEHIEQLMLNQQQPPTNSGLSNLDELEKLASLKDKGIISEEEFAAKKKQLLGI